MNKYPVGVPVLVLGRHYVLINRLFEKNTRY